MNALSTLIQSTKNTAAGYAANFGHKNDSFLAKASAITAGGVGALIGVVMTLGYFPLSIIGGVAVGFLMAHGDWNKGFFSRTASAATGFVLGAAFGPMLLTTKVCANMGLKCGRFADMLIPSSNPSVKIVQNNRAVQQPQKPEKSTFKTASLRPSFDQAALKGEILVIGDNRPKPAPQLPGPQPK